MRRAICGRCLRPQSACICAWIRPVLPGPESVEVLILQHPLEVNEAKGSARLLHLSLANSRMLTGEVFDESVLTSGAGAGADNLARLKHNILLYPALPGDARLQGTEASKSSVLAEAHSIAAPNLRLIVIDGTWRKSRKMLCLNPWLQRLPRLALQDMPASSYRIRKAHKADQLSTLEATCAALAQLERDVEKYQPLLQAFEGFVAEQMARRPVTGILKTPLIRPGQ